MFDNIGQKIKGLAVFSTVLGIICSIICGLILLVEQHIFAGIFALIGGIIVSWIASFVLYGFGELITKVADLEENVKDIWILSVENFKRDKEKSIDNAIKEMQNRVLAEINGDIDHSIAREDECPFCFSKITKDDTVCPNCGNKLN